MAGTHQQTNRSRVLQAHYPTNGDDCCPRCRAWGVVTALALPGVAGRDPAMHASHPQEIVRSGPGRTRGSAGPSPSAYRYPLSGGAW